MRRSALSSKSSTHGFTHKILILAYFHVLTGGFDSAVAALKAVIRSTQA